MCVHVFYNLSGEAESDISRCNILLPRLYPPTPSSQCSLPVPLWFFPFSVFNSQYLASFSLSISPPSAVSFHLSPQHNLGCQWVLWVLWGDHSMLRACQHRPKYRGRPHRTGSGKYHSSIQALVEHIANSVLVILGSEVGG